MRVQNYSFFITRSDWLKTRTFLFTEDGCENAGAWLCGLAKTESGGRLLAREFIPVPDHLYQDRQSFHLEVAPQFYNELVTRCENTGLHPIIIHSHPMAGSARYSQSDDAGESRLLPVLESLLPNRVVASLVVTRDGVTGRRYESKRFKALDGMRTIGSSIASVVFTRVEKPAAPATRFDRQVRALGVPEQHIVSGLRVAVVGLGGTGSIIAEQLARVGVAEIILVDNDVLDESNLSRVVGSTAEDLGKAKVDVLNKHLQRITSANLVAIRDSALKQTVLNRLRVCDAVFGCVDNDRSRAALNRFAYQYLIPVVDMGVRLDARAGRVTAAAGRVSLVGPDMTCLRCSHHLSSDRIRAESLPSEEREKLAKEGYVMGLEEAAPAVVTLNTVVAGLAATALLNVFVGLTGGVQPTNQIYDATSGSVFPISQVHEPGCDVCDPIFGVKGLGDTQIVSAY